MDSLIGDMRDSLRAGVGVLVKGSRANRLERLTAAGVRPSRRAAAEKLPASALRTNDSRLESVSMLDLYQCWKILQAITG